MSMSHSVLLYLSVLFSSLRVEIRVSRKGPRRKRR